MLQMNNIISLPEDDKKDFDWAQSPLF